jgi:hypothetical protein
MKEYDLVIQLDEQIMRGGFYEWFKYYDCYDNENQLKDRELLFRFLRRELRTEASIEVYDLCQGLLTAMKKYRHTCLVDCCDEFDYPPAPQTQPLNKAYREIRKQFLADLDSYMVLRDARRGG